MYVVFAKTAKVQPMEQQDCTERFQDFALDCACVDARSCSHKVMQQRWQARGNFTTVITENSGLCHLHLVVAKLKVGFNLVRIVFIILLISCNILIIMFNQQRFTLRMRNKLLVSIPAAQSCGSDISTEPSKEQRGVKKNKRTIASAEHLNRSVIR